MIAGKRLVVVLPAYNAERTLNRTLADLAPGVADVVLLVDDASDDRTVNLAQDLGLAIVRHCRNLGYGANQKTCYREALAQGADIVVMLHPDYQYSPRLVPALAWLVASGDYDLALGSRVLGKGALEGGMPRYKYVANRALTAVENLLLGMKLSEYHTGFRAYSRQVLEALPLERASDDFVFDNQILAMAIWAGFRIGEISCPARYFAEASSIGFARSVRYGLGVLAIAARFRVARMGGPRSPLFASDLRPVARELR